MYIDFHIHAYADEIADRAVQKLKDTANCNVYTNGRIDDTRQKLQEWGIDYGVLLPVATKPTQQTTINNWANEQNHGNIISFGTVHPDSEELYSELERISSLGLHGVKLHPDYQGHFMFEPCMQRIYEKYDAKHLTEYTAELSRYINPEDLLENRDFLYQIKQSTTSIGYDIT